MERERITEKQLNASGSPLVDDATATYWYKCHDRRPLAIKQHTLLPREKTSSIEILRRIQEAGYLPVHGGLLWSGDDSYVKLRELSYPCVRIPIVCQTWFDVFLCPFL